MSDNFMTGEELGEKLLAAAHEMAAGKGEVVYSTALAARKALGLSQTEFAKLLRVSVRTLQDWEQGRKQPSAATNVLLKIAAQPTCHGATSGNQTYCPETTCLSVASTVYQSRSNLPSPSCHRSALYAQNHHPITPTF